MIALSDEVFYAKNDPNQLSIDQDVIEALEKIHPATISEFDNGNGPVSWVLLIPTTQELMDQFLSKEITEKELFEKTPLSISYEVIYLCSALTLPDYRNKGITKQLAMYAIEQIMKDHPIHTLFVWAFTKDGEFASKSLARQLNLPLRFL